MKKVCKFCSVEVVTYVEHEANPFFMIAAMLVILVLGFLSIIILPPAYLVTKDAVHRCSRCLQKLGQKQCVGLPDNFSDPVSRGFNREDLALPPRQVLDSYIPRVRYYCCGAVCDPVGLLCVLASNFCAA